MPVKQNSEYGISFTIFESAQDEYTNNLKFRLNKRNTEYAHHPFLWDSREDDISVEPDIIGEDICNPLSINLPHVEESVYKQNTNLNLEDNINKTETGINCDSAKSQCHLQDACTQTKLPSYGKGIIQKNAFVPYGIGNSSSSFSPIKRTFNIKSNRDVYPSAIRADLQRREKKAFLSHTYQFDPKSNVTLNKGRPRSLISNGKLDNGDHRPDYGAIKNQSSSYNNGNSKAWLSEYNQKYSVYPSSVYIRSAGMTASRCRPLTSAGSRPGSACFKSILPSTPILLSSRGYNSNLNRRSRDNYCDICSLTAPISRCASQIVSAR